MLSDLTSITFSLAEHNGKPVIFIRFPYRADLNKEVKALPAKWSSSEKAWYVRDIQHYRTLFNLPAKETGKNALVNIHPVNKPAFTKLQETLQLKGYSPNTARTYSLEFAQLLYLLRDYPVESLTYERVRSYILYCIKTLRITESQLHSRINALKFYFEQVLKREKFMMDLPRPKKPFQLPKVLSPKDISKILSTTENLKHRLLLKLCYGMGLRVSEIVHLKIIDIDTKRMEVLVERSKGKKDRYVPLPKSVLADLREYYKTCTPRVYLFEGQYEGRPFSVRSAQAVFKSALTRAGIKRKFGIHALRHSYATHLLEKGTDITFIQSLLGHNSIKTTQIYTHVGKKDIAKITSPLDSLE